MQQGWEFEIYGLVNLFILGRNWNNVNLCLIMGQGKINERAIPVGANKRYRVGVCVPEPSYKVRIPFWWEKVVETTFGLAHFFQRIVSPNRLCVGAEFQVCRS